MMEESGWKCSLRTIKYYRGSTKDLLAWEISERTSEPHNLVCPRFCREAKFSGVLLLERVGLMDLP